MLWEGLKRLIDNWDEVIAGIIQIAVAAWIFIGLPIATMMHHAQSY